MWKDIKDYEGIYQISDDGRVRRIYDTKPPRILKGRPGLYPTVSLCKNGIAKSFSVHRLVAEHYLDKPVGTTEVNHKDGNKWNNDISNLEWVTQRENAIHAHKVLRVGFGKKPRPVRCLDKITRQPVKEYPSIADASRDVSDNPYYARIYINNVCLGRQSTACGYRWEYIND